MKQQEKEERILQLCANTKQVSHGFCLFRAYFAIKDTLSKKLSIAVVLPAIHFLFLPIFYPTGNMRNIVLSKFYHMITQYNQLLFIHKKMAFKRSITHIFLLFAYIKDPVVRKLLKDLLLGTNRFKQRN